MIEITNDITTVQNKMKLPDKSTDVEALYYVMVFRSLCSQHGPKFYFDGDFLAIY